MNVQNFHFHEDGIYDFPLFLPLSTTITLDIIFKTNIDCLKGGEKANCLETLESMGQ